MKLFFIFIFIVEGAIHISHLESSLWECPENGNISVAISLLYDPNMCHQRLLFRRRKVVAFFTCLHGREMCRWHPSPLPSARIWLGKSRSSSLLVLCVITMQNKNVYMMKNQSSSYIFGQICIIIIVSWCLRPSHAG